MRPTIVSFAFTTPESRRLLPMFSMMNEVSATRVSPAVRVRPPEWMISRTAGGVELARRYRKYDRGALGGRVQAARQDVGRRDAQRAERAEQVLREADGGGAADELDRRRGRRGRRESHGAGECQALCCISNLRIHGFSPVCWCGLVGEEIPMAAVMQP
jgi:hypothetical protein